jgi:TfoX/Sxy family transcriptional regulator of competence genes
MAWEKSPPELVARFDELTDHVPDATKRPMFGYPSCTLNGHMFMSLFQDAMVLRLDEDGLAEVMSKHGGETFEPMGGRAMKGYVKLAPAMVADDDLIEKWVRRAHDHAASLPPKKPKAKKS